MSDFFYDLDKEVEKVNNLNNLSFEYRNHDPEYSYGLAMDALKLSKQYSFKKGIAYAYLNIGNYFLSANKLDEAYKNLNDSQSIAKEIDDYSTEVKSYNSIARYYFFKDDYVKCIEFLEEALNICEKNDDDYQISIINNIAVILIRLGKYQDALIYLEKAFKRCIEVNYFDTNVVIANITECYVELKDFNKAEDFYNQIISSDFSLKNPSALGHSNIIMAELYKNQKKIDKSIEYFEKARKIFAETKNSYFYLESAIAYIKFLVSIDYLDKALEVLHETENTIDPHKHEEALSRFYKLFSEVSDKMQMFQEAYIHFKKYFELHEKSSSNSLNKKIETLLKKAEIDEMKKKERLYNEQRLKTLLEITKYSPDEMKDLLSYTTDQILQMTESEFAHLYKYNTTKKDYIFSLWDKSFEEINDSYLKETITNEEKRFREDMIKNQKPIISKKPLFEKSNIKNFFGIPLRVDCNILGISLINGKKEYNNYELNQVRIILDSLDKRLKINRGQINLQNSEKKYRSLIENTQDIIISLDSAYSIISINGAGEKFFQKQRNQIVGKNFLQIGSYLYNKENFLNILDNVKKLKKTLLTDIVYKKDERKVFFNALINPLIDENDYLSAVSIIMRNTTELKKNEEIIKKLAFYDQVTGLPNRNLIKKRIDSFILQEKPFYILYLNINKFKELNNILGQEQTNKILSILASRIKNIFPEENISRINGDEFIVIDNLHFRNKEDLKNKITSIFKEPFEIGEYKYSLNGYVGLSEFPEDAKTTENLIKFANIAANKSKSLGKNSFQTFTPKMLSEMNRELLIKNEIKNALHRGEFYLVYQPIVNPKNGKTEMVEALLRWENPLLGSVSPLEFIPYLEVTGEIRRIGKWITREICKHWKKISKVNNNIIISMNVSPEQIKDANFFEVTKEIVSQCDLDAEKLIIEITESSLMENIEVSTKILKNLRNFGIKIAIDDFGSGYSSFSYLSKLPIDIIKIDKSLIDKIDNPEKEYVLIDTIISLAHKLNLKTISEGIELKNQYEYLKKNNCDYIQGFYFYKPQKIINLLKILNSVE